MSWRAYAAGIGLLFSSCIGAGAEDACKVPPVEFELSVSSPASPASGEVTLCLVIKVAKSWHIYAETYNDGPEQPLMVALSLPPGAETVGGWIGPDAGSPGVLGEGSQMTYIGNVILTQKLRVHELKKDARLLATISWQACSALLCRPPEKHQILVDLH